MQRLYKLPTQALAPGVVLLQQNLSFHAVKYGQFLALVVEEKSWKMFPRYMSPGRVCREPELIVPSWESCPKCH